MTLPLFLTRENKWTVAWIWFFIAATLYMSANWFHIYEPKLLPMGWIDLHTPFIPQTCWIYLSEYFLFPVVYMNCKDMVNANKYIYSFLVLQVVSVFIFWVWPTTFPRDLYPLNPESMDRFTYFAFSALRSSDTPANCCPSLHVSSVYLSTFLFIDEQQKKFPIFFLWATAITISTLTTKQHYLIDLITGLMMAVVVYIIFHRCVHYTNKTPAWGAKR